MINRKIVAEDFKKAEKEQQKIKQLKITDKLEENYRKTYSLGTIPLTV